MQLGQRLGQLEDATHVGNPLATIVVLAEVVAIEAVPTRIERTRSGLLTVGRDSRWLAYLRLSLIHISEPTDGLLSRMPSSA